MLQIYNESDLNIPLTQDQVLVLVDLIKKNEQCDFSFIELVYVDEDEIIRINKEHLQRDYITDIITFRYDDNAENTEIEGTLFCCTPRIIEQAAELDQEVSIEFKRIFIHGILHLIGYSDSTATEKAKMTELEDYYLEMSIEM